MSCRCSQRNTISIGRKDRSLPAFFKTLGKEKREMVAADFPLGYRIVVVHSDKGHHLCFGIVDNIAGTGIKIPRLTDTADIYQIVIDVIKLD